MALDVWIGHPSQRESRLATSFDPEAYYTFLYPLFEDFAAQHGKMIDLYDGAIFEGDELNHVLELVERAKRLVEQQPEVFEVHMGTHQGSYVAPKNEEIYHQVRSASYLVFVAELRSAVLEAKGSNKPLVFFGD